MKTQEIYEEYLAAILKADRRQCHEIIRQAVDNGSSLIDIYSQVFFPAMVKIGELWQHNQISVAQEHLATAITQNIISSLYPTLLQGAKPREGGRVLVACPGDELHELGARMLSDLWELEGWDVSYLGSNIPASYVSDTLEKGDFVALALSCTLSFNLKHVKETIEMTRYKQEFKGPIIVGGRIFNVDASLVKYVGADYHGRDFASAIDILGRLT